MKLHLATLFLLSVTLSPAAIIVSVGNAPGAIEDISLSRELSATSIEGQVGGFLALFTSQNGIDIHGGSIRKTDDLIDGGILFQIPGATFSVFATNAQRGGKPKKGATLLISGVGTLTTVTEVPLTLGPGENRFYVQAQGESLVSVLVGVKGDTYDNYKQPSVGGIKTLPVETPPIATPPVETAPVVIPPIETSPIQAAAVPEATTLSLIGAGLPLLAWLGKRYRKA